MIGLYDRDIYARSTDKELYIPNLEIAKLYSYYTKVEKNYCRLLQPYENDLNAYEKIYYFSENSSIIEDGYKGASNVIFGGSAFNNGIYIPFSNPQIDCASPDISVYKPFLAEKMQNGMDFKIINRFLDNNYYRAFAGQALLKPRNIKPRKKCYLYDSQLHYNDIQQFYPLLEAQKPSSIECIHPIILDIKQFEDYSLLSADNIYIIDIINIPLNELNKILRKEKERILRKKLAVQICNGYNYNYLIIVLNAIYVAWSNGIKLSIHNNNAGILIEALEQYTTLNSQYKIEHTFIEYIKKKHMAEIEKEITKFIQYKGVKYKDLFQQSYAQLSKVGYWRL